MGDHLMTGSLRNSHGFHKGPTGVDLAILPSKGPLGEHAGSPENPPNHIDKYAEVAVNIK